MWMWKFSNHKFIYKSTGTYVTKYWIRVSHSATL